MMQRTIFTGVLLIAFVWSVFSQTKIKPIITSHNFASKTELWESVGNGIFNFEADVMYIYGKLYVTPVMPDSANHRIATLLDTYLYPIYNQFKKNNGEIIPGYNGDIYLILNISCQPTQVYRQLSSEMRPFSDMLSFEIDGVKHPGKLQILIKDKNQLAAINDLKPSFLALVGNMGDIEKKIDSHEMPIIEIDFNEITSWKGMGNIPFEDFMKLKELVAKVQAQNKKISIKNCPINKVVADIIIKSKANYINTPEASKMAGFLTSEK